MTVPVNISRERDDLVERLKRKGPLEGERSNHTFRRMNLERVEAAARIEALETASEVARQALDVIESVQNYKQPHDPWEENALTMCEHEVFDFDVDTARAVLNKKGERVLPPTPPAEAIEHLAGYQQADEDGVMVLVSRQAIEECLPYLRAAKGGG